MEQQEKPVYNISKTTKRVVIVLLFAALLASLVWFALDVHSLYRDGAITDAGSRIHRRAPMPPLSPAQIQGWMTFRYVGFVFHLPASYLASQFGITTPNFLNTTLNNYAAGHKLNASSFVQQVREVVVSYQGGVHP